MCVYLTRMMKRMANTPDVAMTLAQLGMRLKRMGTMASAPWSNLFPSTIDKLLSTHKRMSHNMASGNKCVL